MARRDFFLILARGWAKETLFFLSCIIHNTKHDGWKGQSKLNLEIHSFRGLRVTEVNFRLRKKEKLCMYIDIPKVVFGYHFLDLFFINRRHPISVGVKEERKWSVFYQLACQRRPENYQGDKNLKHTFVSFFFFERVRILMAPGKRKFRVRKNISLGFLGLCIFCVIEGVTENLRGWCHNKETFSPKTNFFSFIFGSFYYS